MCVCVCLCVCARVSLCVRRHVAILLGACWMADYETLHVCRVSWCQQCVKLWWWPSAPIKFLKRFIVLFMLFYRHSAPYSWRGHSFCGSCYAQTPAVWKTVAGHTSLTTALVVWSWWFLGTKKTYKLIDIKITFVKFLALPFVSVKASCHRSAFVLMSVDVIFGRNHVHHCIFISTYFKYIFYG